MNLHIKNELAAMTERMFSRELYDSILAAYQREMDESGCAAVEREYQKGREALAPGLSAEQRADLARAEALCAENAAFAMQLGFPRGLYACFQQFFVKETTDSPFRDLVVEQLLIDANPGLHMEFKQKRSEACELLGKLGDQLGGEAEEHCISVSAAWENRIYGVLRYAFYLGYRYGQSVLREVEPVGVIVGMTGKTLLTEYEMGFTATAEERERLADLPSSKKRDCETARCLNPEV